MGFQLFILLLRGPHCQRYTWFGYEGGLSARKGVHKKPAKNGDVRVDAVDGQSEDLKKEGNIVMSPTRSVEFT